MYKLENINKEIYNKKTGRKSIINDVTLDIHDGEFIVIKGDNGAGKSTLLSILGLVSLPTNGNVYFDEEQIAYNDSKKRALLRNNRIGYIFQHNELIPYRNVIDNAMVPLLISRKSMSECQTIVADTLKYIGIDNLKTIKVKNLSGGEEKKVAIARAIVNSPDLILADEPISSLDIDSKVAIVNLFRKINEEGKTIIVISHDNLFDNVSTRELIMKDGKIVYDYKK